MAKYYRRYQHHIAGKRRKELESPVDTVVNTGWIFEEDTNAH